MILDLFIDGELVVRENVTKGRLFWYRAKMLSNMANIEGKPFELVTYASSKMNRWKNSKWQQQQLDGRFKKQFKKSI